MAAATCKLVSCVLGAMSACYSSAATPQTLHFCVGCAGRSLSLATESPLLPLVPRPAAAQPVASLIMGGPCVFTCLLHAAAGTSTLHCCRCSQQIRFGLQSPQEIISCGVFHAYERALYKVRRWQAQPLVAQVQAAWTKVQ